MSRILNCTRLDFTTALSSMMMAGIMLLISIVIGFLTKMPVISEVLIMAFSVFVGGNVFQLHEKNHSEKLYGILPIRRSDMIVGRYVYALVIGLVAGILATVVAWAVTVTTQANYPAFDLLGAVAIAFVYYSFAVGVSYPIFFKFSFAKAYIFTMLPLYLVVIASILIGRKTNVGADLASTASYFAPIVGVIPLIGLVVGLVLLVVSGFISNAIYAHKEV